VNHIIDTERLVLRELTLDDFPFIIKLVNSAGWLKYIGDKNVHTPEQAKQYLLNGPLKSYHDNGFGLSLIVRKVDQEPVGMCGLLKRNFLEQPDIGFALLPEYYGEGYAYEITNATLQYAFKTLNLKTILAVVMPENEKSKRVLEKIGLKYIKPVHFPGETQELLLYSNEIQSEKSK